MFGNHDDSSEREALNKFENGDEDGNHEGSKSKSVVGLPLPFLINTIAIR